MKLMYRGIPYEASFSHEPAAEASKLNRFRHSPASDQGSTKAQLKPPGNELTYRGVRYKP